MWECVCSQIRTHLSFHAADANQLIQDQKSTMDPVVTIHPFLFGQSLIKAFLCLLKGLLLKKDKYSCCLLQGHRVSPGKYNMC